MKPLQVAVRVSLAAGLLTLARPAFAQLLAAPRGDVSASIGWLAVNKESPAGFDSYDDWNSSLYGGVAAGWHWTRHHKTEVDFGAGTKARSYRVQPIAIDGRPIYVSSETTFSQRTVGISQQYQFFENAWFHPHIAAGVHVTWEQIRDRFHPIVIYDQPNRPGRVVQPEQVLPARTEVLVDPFVAGGFKAYLSRRAFFRNDLRVAFGAGVEAVTVRAGFGFDF